MEEVTLGPFKASISFMGHQRVILIPKDLHDKVKPFENQKKSLITVTIQDIE